MNNEKTSEVLPETINTFFIDSIGQVTKKQFSGDFQSKVPTIKDQCMIGKFEAALNGPNVDTLHKAIKDVHEKVAYLKYTLVDSPPWWKNSDFGYDLRDQNILTEVFEKALAFENEWLAKIWGTNESKT